MDTIKVVATYCQYCKGDLESDNKSSYHLSCKYDIDNFKPKPKLVKDHEIPIYSHYHLPDIRKKWIRDAITWFRKNAKCLLPIQSVTYWATKIELLVLMYGSPELVTFYTKKLWVNYKELLLEPLIDA